MANNKWLLLALVPLLAAATEPGSVEVAQELASDDECQADSASSCAFNALQKRQAIAMGDASGGAAAAKEARDETNEAAPEKAVAAAQEDASAVKTDKVLADDDKADKAVMNEDKFSAAEGEVAADQDLSLMAHLMLTASGEEDEDADAADDCPKDTGGSCRFLTCDGSRNAFCKKAACHQNWMGYDHCTFKCLCPAGYCARDGSCVKSQSSYQQAIGGGRVTQQEISDVKNHFGLNTKQMNLCVKEFVSTDRGAKGFITADDLVADVQKRGKQVSKSQMQAFIKQYDLNHDGKLTFFEFGYMFSQTQKR